ncbi:MAG: NAD(P)H-dependent oxidoreductase, partial [Aquabacterium sp.]|nr:NAD(P)H-dependent oxidoreductase [Aquabacterium sp.]
MTASNLPRPVRLLAISGSARQGSLNRQLVDLAARKAQALGAEVTHVDLRELALPVYDDDWAAAHGKPEGALRLRALFASHDGLLLACPEYNA